MGSRIRAALLAALVVSGALVVVAPPAAAAATLTVTPTTWDIIGLDSNKPSVSNGRPNEFPVAAKVCNTGDVAATSVQAVFNWTTANANLSLANANTTRTLGTLSPGACTHATYNVLINRNQQSFTNRARGYQITATAAGGISASTPANREVYVERLVSQSRNSVLGITSAACTGGSCTVYRGQTYRFTLTSKTATQGYEQLETFVNFPDSIFEIQDIATTYAAPSNARNDKVYADACGWDPVTTSTTYRSCVGPTKYAGGKAGGAPITTVYTVKVVGTGSGTLSGLVYDFSGSSFHYNADFGTGVNAVPFVAADAADLSLTKTHTGAFVRGGTGTYRLTVSNAGPATSGNVTITDTLPAGLTYRSFSGTGWSCSGCSSSSQTVTLTRAGLASGASSFVDLTVDVALNAGASLTNNASVSQVTSTSLNDPVSGNNTASDTTTTANAGDADLVVTKTRDDVMTPGGEETYTISVRNDGPGTVVGPVTMTDVLPQGLTYVSATGNGWTCSASGQTVTCTRPGNLTALETAPPITLVVSVAPDAPARSTNRTSATGSFDNDPNDPNNVDVLDVVRVGSADLWIEKTHTGSFSRGGNGKYTITVGNRGPHAAETPRVVDTLPAGLTYTSATGTGWTCSNSGQTVTCDAASDLAANTTASALTINVAVAAGAAGTVTNRATVCSVQDPGAVTGCPDQNQGTTEVAAFDNSAEDLTATTAPTDLSLAKAASVTSVAASTPFDYTLTVTNNGPNPATNVTIVDTLPVYIDPASITTDPGPSNTSTPPYCDVTNREVTCSMGTLPATAGSNTATATITAEALPTAAGRTIVNSATAFSDLGDPAPGNDAASAPVSVTGALVNSAPVAANRAMSVAHRSLTGADVVLTATDSDGDPLTFALDAADGGALHGTVTVSGNIATYVPDGDFTGTDTFQYRAHDGAESSAPATVTVTVTNTAPTAADRNATVPHRSTGEDITLNGNDPDGDPLSFTLDGANGGAAHGTVTVSGNTATYVPTGDFTGTDTFRYRSGDGSATSALATVTVTLTNSAPALASAALSPRTVGTNGTLTATATSPSDADGDSLTYTYVWTRTRGGDTQTVRTTTATGSATDQLTLTGAVAGDAIEVTITANDGHTDSPQRTDSVVVGNSAPTATAASDTTDEDTAETLTLAGSDPDGDDLTFEVTSLPAHGVLFDGTGTAGAPISALPFELTGAAVTYRPDPGYNGPDDFDFRTFDGATASAPAAATLTVMPVNDAPAAGGGTLTVAGDQTSGQLDLANLAADEETADADLTYQIVTAPSGGTATIAGSVVTYTRTAPGRTDDSFVFEVVDRGDPDGCGLPVPGTCTLPLDSNDATVNVSFDNAAPVATPGVETTTEDVAVTITLAGTDADGDDLTYSVTSLPAHGDLYAGNDPSGTALATLPAALPGTRVTYLPDPDYNGDDSFEFVAFDGTATSSAADVDLTVTPVNDAPEASDGTIAVAGGSTTGSVDLATVADDTETSDANLTYDVVSAPGYGNVTFTGSTLSYTRTAPGRDADELTFTVTDRGDPDACGAANAACAASLTSTPATISITFGNAAPAAAGGSATTPEDTPVSLSLDGSDPDGDELTYVVTSLPSNGTLRSSGNDVTTVPFDLPGRAVTYVPDQDYNGGDSFGFETSDGRLDSGAATFSLTVTPVNDRPVADDGGMTVSSGQTTGQLDLAELARDVETADADLIYELVSQPTKGTATLTGSTIDYSRTTAGRDADQLTFKVTDRGDPDDCGAAGAGCAAARESVVATVTVTFDYTRPTADDQTLQTPEDTPLTVALTGTSPSEPGSPFEIRTLPQHGSLLQGQTELGTVPFELAGAGVVYVPDPNYSGADSFTFVKTGLQDSAPAEVAVTVTPVNDVPVANDAAADAPPATTTTLSLDATDVDHAGLDLAVVDAPANGTLGPLTVRCTPAGAGTSCTASVDYTPAAGYEGADRFTFVADDGIDVSPKATVSLNVPAGPAVPPPPTGGGDDGVVVTPSPTPTPSPSASPTPTVEPTPTPTATPTPTPDGENPCGLPIEVEANGEPIVGTPCGELITVHADVPATIEALGGNDTIFVFGSAEVHVSAGGGDDEVSCLESTATVLGGGGNDAIECGAGNDVLRGGRGDDAIAAGDGDDKVSGGNGGDGMDGSAGDDLLIGGRGQDDLFGGGGDDVLKGQAKNDLIRAGAGTDLLRGARGDDVEYGGKGADRVQAGPGNDRIWGGRGSDRLQGNDGDDSIQGGGGDDFVRGRAGDDVIKGRGGNDVLRGGPGDDVLRGVGGDDELQSGSGSNDVDGGLGIDLCVTGDRGNVWSGCERLLKRKF